jgi:protein disulfide-isomerase A1
VYVLFTQIYRQAAPILRELDATNFLEFQNSDRIVIVGYVGDDQEATDLLKKLAAKHHSNTFFGIVTDPALAQEHHAPIPSFVVYKQFDEGRNDYTGLLIQKSVEDFITRSSVPLLQDINISNLRYYIECGIPLAYMFHDNEQDKEALREIFSPIALKHKGKVNFVFMDGKRYEAHVGNVGLKEAKFPAIAIQHFEEGTKYPFDQTKEISAESMETFVQDYVDGKLVNTVRSAEAPEQNDGDVKIVVADEFSEIVLDGAKDVFLNIYAPWGDEAADLETAWEKLGKAAASEKSLVIARLDHSTNDVPEAAGFRIAGLPTLVLYKADTNERIHYDGDLSLKSFVEFVNEHSSQSVKLSIQEDKQEEEKTETTTEDKTTKENPDGEKESTTTHDEL